MVLPATLGDAARRARLFMVAWSVSGHRAAAEALPGDDPAAAGAWPLELASGRDEPGPNGLALFRAGAVTRDGDAAQAFAGDCWAAVAREVQRRLSNAKETEYGHSYNHWYYFVDDARGVYKYDCSGFAFHVLQHVGACCGAARELAAFPRPLSIKQTPTPRGWVRFFESLEPLGQGAPRLWLRVTSLHDLRPGDIMAWNSSFVVRRPGRPVQLRESRRTRGHVVIVMRRPEALFFHRRDGSRLYRLLVADSTTSLHAKDSREGRPTARRGMGTGEIGVSQDGAMNLRVTWAPWASSRQMQHVGLVGRAYAPHTAWV